jgi:hypothetical protein
MGKGVTTTGQAPIKKHKISRAWGKKKKKKKKVAQIFSLVTATFPYIRMGTLQRSYFHFFRVLWLVVITLFMLRSQISILENVTHTILSPLCVRVPT